MSAYLSSEGIVLCAHERGEADLLLAIMTEKTGLLYALAKSVRQERSKLRPHLARFTSGTFLFVNGKAIWRLIDAQERLRIRPRTGSAAGKEPDEFASFASISSLLLRMVRGAAVDKELWREAAAAHDYFASPLSTPMRAVASLAFQVRLLNRLGYVAAGHPLDIVRELLIASAVSHTLIAALRPHTRALTAVVAHAIHASQM